MGQSGSDIILSPDIKKVFPFYIECKRHEDKTWNASCMSSWNQVCDNEYPLLIRRKSRGKNHYFAKTEDVLKFHPRILQSNKPLKMYRCLRDMLKSDNYNVGISEEYVHFDDGKFVELIQCLKNSCFQ